MIDSALSLVGLIFALWLYSIIVVIKIDDPSPMFFIQKRMKKGKDLEYELWEIATEEDKVIFFEKIIG